MWNFFHDVALNVDVYMNNHHIYQLLTMSVRLSLRTCLCIKLCILLRYSSFSRLVLISVPLQRKQLVFGSQQCHKLFAFRFTSPLQVDSSYLSTKMWNRIWTCNLTGTAMSTNMERNVCNNSVMYSALMLNKDTFFF